jgi:hypothetical protein
MAVQAATAVGRLKRPAFPIVDSPVFARRPAFLLVWMTVDGPGAEHRIEHVTKALKDSCADDVRLVLGPADNHGIQLSNHRFLIRVLVAVHRLPEFLDMSLDSCLAGLDARFEAMPASPAVLPRLGCSDRVLPDGKAAEVKPWRPVWDAQRVSDPGLTGLQCYSSLFQPRGGYVLTLLDDLEIFVQEREIIGVANNIGGVKSPASAAWKRRDGELFPPCMVPSSVGNSWPSSSTPA